MQFLAGDGMLESQTEGVQAHASHGVALTAIFAVTHNGVAQHAHVNAYLVFAPSVQVQLNE